MHIQQNCSAVSQFVESVKRYMTPVKYLSLQTCFFFFLFSFASSSIRRIVVVVFVLSIFRPCRRQKTMWLYVAFDVNCLYRHSVVRIYRCQTIRLSVTNYVTVSSCSCKINKNNMYLRSSNFVHMMTLKYPGLGLIWGPEVKGQDRTDQQCLSACLLIQSHRTLSTFTRWRNNMLLTTWCDSH